MAEAAVIGLPERVRGKVPVAYVVLKSTIDCAVLAERCRAKRASFRAPREFIAVDPLPRNAMGKVQKHLLLDRLA